MRFGSNWKSTERIIHGIIKHGYFERFMGQLKWLKDAILVKCLILRLYHKSSSEVKSGDPENSLFQCMIAKIDAVTYKLYRGKMGQNRLPQNKREQLGFLDII